MLIQWYKTLALGSALLWSGTGIITIGSIAVSSIGWGINMIMGLIFIAIGWFLYLRASNFYRFYASSTADTQKNSHISRFLRLDLILVSLSCFVGGLLLMESIFRAFGEGYAIFG